MATSADINRNLALIPWFGFLRNLIFWQATWFLYFQSELSAPEAILLYVVYDLSTTVLEVPSGYFSDRFGRRLSLVLSAIASLIGTAFLALGVGGFGLFVLAQFLLGAHAAFVSGTDSSMLYESLAAEERDAEIERYEVRVWRFSFVGLAVSAVLGGAMALISPLLPFVASTVAGVALVWLSLQLRDPKPADQDASSQGMAIDQIRQAMHNPVLRWLFWLGVLMYGFSHIPFVFGQPFILDALAQAGYDGEAPFVSGIVTAIMMVLSFSTSLIAPSLRAYIGLVSMLLLAFGIQVGLAMVLGLTNAPWAIALLFLRMVPDSLSRPFILARIQPLLQNQSRATFLSLRSFVGRLIFAGSLFLAAGSTWQAERLSHVEMQPILISYGVFGLLALVVFGIKARRIFERKKST